MRNLIKSLQLFILCLVICFLSGCGMDYSTIIVERVVTTNGNFNGKCKILIGDNDWNHSDSKWIDDCPCSKYSPGDTLELITK